MEAILPVEVRQALVDYANALTETPEYQHYEETSFAIMLNTLNEDDRSELLRRILRHKRHFGISGTALRGTQRVLLRVRKTRYRNMAISNPPQPTAGDGF